jgi:hypothetical protein
MAFPDAPQPKNSWQESKLLPKEIREQLPALYNNEAIGLLALAQVKFFTPDSNWTWYASEGSPVDEDDYCDTDKEKVSFLLFGLVVGFEMELGYFDLGELEEVRGPLNLPIERDLYFKPQTLEELMVLHQRGR